MPVMTHRLQILLDEERYERVVGAASKQRISVAAVIRDAIDASLGHDDARRIAAADRILGAEPIEVPPGDELVDELKDLRDERHSALS